MKFLDLLCELQYIEIDKDERLKVIVPIFYTSENTIISEVADIVLTAIYPIVKQTIDNINEKLSQLTAIKQGVNISEIANELWHQIFGHTNEYIVKIGFVQKPIYKASEGRYLKSILVTNTEK